MNTEPVRVVVHPPLAYLVPLAAGIVVHFVGQPLGFFPRWWPGHAAGWPVVVAGVGLLVWGWRTMLSRGEHPNIHKPTNTIVSTGPFAFSRNPLYISLTLIYVGISLVVNIAWPMVFLPVVLIVMHYGVILREERYLESLFGDEYRQYRARVRRWL